MASPYRSRTAHNPGNRLNPSPGRSPTPGRGRPVSPRPPQRTNPLRDLPSAFPRRRGRGGIPWGRIPGPLGAALGAGALVYEYYNGWNNPKPFVLPDWFQVTAGRIHYWDGVDFAPTQDGLLAQLGCRVWSMTSRLDRNRSTWMRFFEPGIPCSPIPTSRAKTSIAVYDLPPGPPLYERPEFPPNPPAPFPGGSPWGDPGLYPGPRPDGSPGPRPRPRPRPRREPKPRLDLSEVGVTLTPGKNPVVVPRPQPRPPTRPTKERKVHGKIGAISTAVFWLWEMVDDARDWRDIILGAKKAGDGRPIPKGEAAKWAALADPSTFTNLDPRSLIEGIAEFYIEEFVGAKLADFEKQFAAMVDSPLTSKWGVTSGQDWGVDSERGGTAIKEALDWLSAQYDAFAEE